MTDVRLVDLADELKARMLNEGGGAASITGGRPVEHPAPTWGLADAIRADRERLAERSGAIDCAREVIGWTSPTANSGDAHPSTITPPARPGLTAEQIEKLADTLEELVAFLRRRL